jgi:hypothetical protein
MDKLSHSLNSYLHKHKDDEMGGKKKVASKMKIDPSEEWNGRIGARKSFNQLKRNMTPQQKLKYMQKHGL